MGRCPECGSSRIDQYRMPYGPMWCRDCGFRVEEKTASPNPFLEPAEAETAAQQQPQDEPPTSLGAALHELSRAAREADAIDPPETKQSTDGEAL